MENINRGRSGLRLECPIVCVKGYEPEKESETRHLEK